MGKRKLNSWVEGFYEYTKDLPSPQIFRKWAAISAVAGTLERRVWVRVMNFNTYPNMYVIIVAPPGVGKTVLTAQVQRLWQSLVDKKKHYVSSASVTKASLIDDLRDAERSFLMPGQVPPMVTYNSLKICANEFSTLLPSYDGEFMSVLTDLWDCHGYSERRRTKDLNFKIPNPQLNMIAATTPAYLTSMLPEGAWDQGFLSRVMLIYSGESVIRDLFTETEQNIELYKDLEHDLLDIAELCGKMVFAKDAAEMINDWHKGGRLPAPDHPKLVNYNTRRTIHLIKLAMVACAETGDSLVISLDHMQTALEWLIEAETYIPDIFKAMGSGGDGKVMEELWHFAYKAYIKSKKPISENRLIYFLSERTPAHNVERILQVMVKARIFTKTGAGYVPHEMKKL